MMADIEDMTSFSLPNGLNDLRINWVHLIAITGSDSQTHQPRSCSSVLVASYTTSLFPTPSHNVHCKFRYPSRITLLHRCSGRPMEWGSSIRSLLTWNLHSRINERIGSGGLAPTIKCFSSGVTLINSTEDH
jgi:hypothetical protein